MSRLIIRPLFVLVTLASLVIAIFQVSGRLMFSVLDELEGGVNQWLSPQQIVISGLTGDWQWLNPVVNVERVELPAGFLSGVHLELDWVESLVRNELVARRVMLREGRLLLERSEAGGWRLVGTGGGGEFNPLQTLYQSDQIQAVLTLGFVGEDGEAAAADDVTFRYTATNRGGRHQHRLHLDNPVCTVPCDVVLALDEIEAIPLIRPRAVQARAGGGGLRIPAPLLGGGGGRIAQVGGHWWRQDADSGGEATFSLADLEIDDEHLSAGFRLASRGEGDVHHLALSELHVDSGERRWQLPEVWMTYAGGMDQGVLSSWTERVEAGAGFAFFAAIAPRESAVFRWLNALKVQAVALNVHGIIEFPGLRSGYMATVRDVSLDGFNGAPWLRGAAGELVGADGLIQLSINAENLGMQFPDMFHQRWTMEHMNGRLQAYVSRDYFGMKGSNLRAGLNGSQVSGGFSLSRPRDDRYRERLSLLISVDQTSVARAKEYIPYRLPEGLPEWLDSGPRAGLLSDVSFAYHGQIHTRPFELGRRVEFAARIRDGIVQYHPDWPEVRGLSGAIAVAGRDVRIRVDEGTSLIATDLSGSRIRLGDDASFADIDLVSSSSVDEVLTFIRDTPLMDWMSFVTPDWDGRGPVSMSGYVRIPLKLSAEHIGETSMEEGLAVDLDVELEEADLDLPGYGVALGSLVGDVRYRYPYGVSGSNVQGRIFDRPAVFGASSDEDTVIFRVDGQAPYEDVLTLLEMSDPGVIRGGFDFLAELHIELGDAVSRLDVVSDLTGLMLDLPGEFAKEPDASVPTELELRFLDDYQSVRFRYADAQGWLHVDGAPLRGAIGFAGPPPMVDTASNALVLGGRIDRFSVEEVVPGEGDGGLVLAIPLELAGLEVGLIDVNGVPFENAVLNGRIDPSPDADGVRSVHLDVASADLEGFLAFQGDDPLVLDLLRLRLPAGDGEEGADPLDVSIIPELVDADVTVADLQVGGVDYGAWSFRLRPDAGGVALEGLSAQLRGVAITAEDLYWDAEANRSRFSGTLLAADLAEVLPQWGYAPSVTTESASLDAALSWKGSPAAVDLPLLVGQASFRAGEGRFLEVTTGGTDAMKIFSLVNFSTIAKRLNFDFSDVVGEGVSFERLTASADFQEGTMQFTEPMTVNGSGSSFRIAGSVDLVEGSLDNEMIVTLPVTKSLPWYAAYVALANPLAGLGVLVGERVLRKPLEQFSSAKYEISGTLDDPELKFVGVWDTSMDKPQASLIRPEGDAVEGEGEADAPAETPGETETREEAATRQAGPATT